MSDQKPVDTPVVAETTEQKSKKADKKAAKEAAKEAAKKERQQQQQQTQAPAFDEALAKLSLEDVQQGVKPFGYYPLIQSRPEGVTRTLTEVKDLDLSKVPSDNNNSVPKTVWIRARIYRSRSKGKMAFLVLRQGYYSVQVLIIADDVKVPKDMVKFAAKLNPQSIVDIEGVVNKVEQKIEGCTQQDIEISALRIYCVSESEAPLPLQIQDAERPEPKEEPKEGELNIRVNQDTRLDNRVIDLRVPAHLAIFRLQSAVGQLFREYLYTQGFCEIHTPKMIQTASEGGANVFSIKYFDKTAFLAQSPQLYKQMAVNGDLMRVFEIGPVFRAENSNTHRHLTEFVGLDLEMAIQNHYYEVLEVMDEMFIYIFDNLTKRFSQELQIVSQQYPFQPLQYYQGKKSLRLSFSEGIKLLNETGLNLSEDEDIDTPSEKKLGEIVKQKYGTDFYILDRYPSKARPFYTMPCPDDARFTNSYDLFLRGEEITSGSQRIHDSKLLIERATNLGVNLTPIQAYVDAFKYGAWPHGGCGIGLERVVMLYLDLGNIRRSSMFPRDPRRVTP